MDEEIKSLFNYTRATRQYTQNLTLKRIYTLTGEKYLRKCTKCNGTGRKRKKGICDSCKRGRGFHILWDRIEPYFYKCKKCNGGGLIPFNIDYHRIIKINCYEDCNICEGSGLSDWLYNLTL
jgi:hypothetical protein